MAVNLVELRKASESLDEALKADYSDIVRDASIQRFEFCVELSWKCINGAMGTSSVAPRAVIREAAQQGLIADPKKWLGYLDARNLTSHTYNEGTAIKVFEQVKLFYPDLQVLIESLESF